MSGWTPDSIARGAPPPKPPGNPLVPWLAVIAVLLGIVAFWVIATPHEQCYISDGRPFAVERPIERTSANTYRGVPSEFQDDGMISSRAEIECRWELGAPYRVTLFGR